MVDCFIATGCSFTADDLCWPTTIGKKLNASDFHNLGFPSAGNGYISRATIYQVSESLKIHKPENILVAVMWSGSGRHEFFREYKVPNQPVPSNERPYGNHFITQAPGSWEIANVNWTNENRTSELWYNNFYHPVFGEILTLEHILRVQNFLNLHGIRHVMARYAPACLPEPRCPNTEHLYDLIDWSKFVPGDCMSWCVNHSGLPNEVEVPPDAMPDYIHCLHPTGDQHQAYAEREMYRHIIALYPELKA